MIAPADFQLKQMLDILKLRIAKRGIDVGCLEVKDPEVNLAQRQTARDLEARHRRRRRQEGLASDQGFEAESSGANSGRQGRVTGKKRDDLQEAIAFLRKADVGVPLQFNNFRD